MSTIKTLTIRLSDHEYLEARQLADRENKSLNQLAREGLAQLAREAKRRRLYDDFTQLGDDAAESSVEFATEAQAEILD